MTTSRIRLRLLWLTLFAFGVQIAVADFHHHISRGSGIEARALTAGMCPPRPGHPCAPLQKGGHDGCALCWATAIAATSLTPELFHVPVPSEVVGSKLRSLDPPRAVVRRFALVRARGPPVTSSG
ncbi:MAG: hypothetical protein JSR99_04405 [Proteobacteria bacterium]|nr:hypothetical protein [Pseudomonadota bacterium]